MIKSGGLKELEFGGTSPCVGVYYWLTWLTLGCDFLNKHAENTQTITLIKSDESVLIFVENLLILG